MEKTVILIYIIHHVDTGKYKPGINSSNAPSLNVSMQNELTIECNKSSGSQINFTIIKLNITMGEYIKLCQREKAEYHSKEYVDEIRSINNAAGEKDERTYVCNVSRNGNFSSYHAADPWIIPPRDEREKQLLSEIVPCIEWDTKRTNEISKGREQRTLCSVYMTEDEAKLKTEAAKYRGQLKQIFAQNDELVIRCVKSPNAKGDKCWRIILEMSQVKAAQEIIITSEQLTKVIDFLNKHYNSDRSKSYAQWFPCNKSQLCCTNDSDVFFMLADEKRTRKLMIPANVASSFSEYLNANVLFHAINIHSFIRILPSLVTAQLVNLEQIHQGNIVNYGRKVSTTFFTQTETQLTADVARESMLKHLDKGDLNAMARVNHATAKAARDAKESIESPVQTDPNKSLRK